MEWRGKRVSGRQWMACKLWEIIRTGRVTFPGEEVVLVSLKEWIGICQWMYAQIDGPPKVELAVDANITHDTGLTDDQRDAAWQELARRYSEIGAQAQDRPNAVVPESGPTE